MAEDYVQRKRNFYSLSFKGAHYRCAVTPGNEIPESELLPRVRANTTFFARRLRSLRRELERYIRRYPSFGTRFTPLVDEENLIDNEKLPKDSTNLVKNGEEPAEAPPESAIRMHRASVATLQAGEEIEAVGPMAAVAGTFAELLLEEALCEVSGSRGDETGGRGSGESSGNKTTRSQSPEAQAGGRGSGKGSGTSGSGGRKSETSDIVIENGGDIAAVTGFPLHVALFVGSDSPFTGLAFRIEGDGRRHAICSSSGKRGHSTSFGVCDVATVFSRSAPLADAAATALCNAIKSQADMEEKLEAILKIDGVDGAVAVLGDRFGRVGDIPPIVTHKDPDLTAKMSRDPASGPI